MLSDLPNVSYYSEGQGRGIAGNKGRKIHSESLSGLFGEKKLMMLFLHAILAE